MKGARMMPHGRARPVIYHGAGRHIIDGRRSHHNRGHDGLNDHRSGLLFHNSGLSGRRGCLSSSRRVLDDSGRRRRHRCGLRNDGLLINNRGGWGVIDSRSLAHQMRPVARRRTRIRLQRLHQDSAADDTGENLASGRPFAISGLHLTASACGDCRYGQRNDRSFN